MSNLKETLRLSKARLESIYSVLSGRFQQAEKKNEQEASKWLEKEMSEMFEATEAIRYHSEATENYIQFLEKWVNELLKGQKQIDYILLDIESKQRIQIYQDIAEIRRQRGLRGVSKDQENLVIEQLKSLKRTHEAHTAKNNK